MAPRWALRWKADSSWSVVVVGVVVIGWPLLHGTLETRNFLAASRLDIFVLYTTSPLMLVMPLLAASAGSTRLVAELGNRHLANVRARRSATDILFIRLRRGTLVPAALFAASIVAVGIVVFIVGPAFGLSPVDPSVHDLMTPQDITHYEATVTGLSQTIVAGPLVFTIAYAAWNGFVASVYGALAVATMIVTGSRVAGLLLPIGLYLVESIIAASLVHTYAALMYSFAPAALMQAPILVTIAPTLVLAVVVAVMWAIIFHQSDNLAVLR